MYIKSPVVGSNHQINDNFYKENMTTIAKIVLFLTT